MTVPHDRPWRADASVMLDTGVIGRTVRWASPRAKAHVFTACMLPYRCIRRCAVQHRTTHAQRVHRQFPQHLEFVMHRYNVSDTCIRRRLERQRARAAECQSNCHSNAAEFSGVAVNPRFSGNARIHCHRHLQVTATENPRCGDILEAICDC
jgi:hypothetical protein